MSEAFRLLLPSSPSSSSVEKAPESNSNENLRDELEQVKGLTVGWATVFIIGETLGTGSLVMPYGLAKTGWAGLPLILLCTTMCVYAAVLLGRSWVIVLERYPEARHARNPFALIGEKAFGTWMRVTMSVVNVAVLLGGCTVLLLMSGQNVQSLLARVHVEFSYCYSVLVMVLFIVPLSWLGTPKNFRFIAMTAAVTMCSAVLIALIISIRSVQLGPSPPRASPTPGSAVLMFGIVFFAYGASGSFPTIQQDMKDPALFTRSLLMSGVFLLLFFTLISSIGYGAYGSDVNGNLILSLPRGIAKTITEILIIVHLLSALILLFNPVAQEFENIECFNVPLEFGWRRCGLRTLLVLVVAFIAQSLPNFSALLSLLGASLVCFSTLVAPPILYWRLCAASGPWERVELITRTKIGCVCVVSLGVFGGVTSTYSSLLELTSAETFVPPCYVNLTAASQAR